MSALGLLLALAGLTMVYAGLTGQSIVAQLQSVLSGGKAKK